ncbi:MAG TPA: sugar phosphate isomerase/epimerase [Verrucomicrobiae bacterium]|nr:sugar phosphate isomerase/epimerase [Verrucomicrobiae bacterium]
MKSNFTLLLASTTSLLLLATTVLRAAPVGTGPSFKGPVGLQLYSLRAQFAKDVPGTLDEVKSWGIKYVELAGTYGLSPAQFKSELAARGLVPISAHFDYNLYKNDPEKVAAEAKALGLQYAGCAWIPHEGDFTEQTCREAITVFNHAGEVMARHGLKFFYHVHGFEFQPYKDGTLLDLLFQETNPKYVNYQMDIFWIVFPGQDPVKLLEKYPHRWQLAHLKDMRKGTVTGALTGGTDVKNDAALGTGMMDMPAILRAAKKAGVKWYFIEDESPWSEKQVPESLKYLEEVRF